MEESTRYQKIKQHLKDNKKVYLVGAGCLTAGYLLRGVSSPNVIQTFNGTDNIGLIVNKSKNVDVVIKYLNQRNYPANPVRCLETLEKWSSQAEAALAKGISETNLSQHLNGKYPHANGLHFERITI